MKTREHILDTAIALFNENGSAAISTNHIAEAAGISPGNLYYHYRNKEAIIQAIFERLFARWDVAFNLPADRAPTLTDVQNLVRTNFAIMAEYRFIYREIIALLQNDETLRQRYIEVRARGYEGFREIMASLAGVGILRPGLSPATLEALADLCWLISEFWLASLEISGYQPDDAQLQRGIDRMMHVLEPYMTA